MQRGFTITELAVVLIIASILVVLSIPTYKSVMVTARRGEAKVNLSHIDSLQSVFKVAGSNFTYGTIPASHPVGYASGGGCSGSGWDNELGFRPNRCGELRYQYWTTGGGGFTAVAYGPSDAPGKYIYPDCNGAGGSKTCNAASYSQGDVLTLASSSGKVETCRNILEYCPGGGTGVVVLPPPPPCTCNTWSTLPAANTICQGATAPGTKTCTSVTPSGCTPTPPSQSVTVTGTKPYSLTSSNTVNSTNTHSPSTATSAANVCSNKTFSQTTTDTYTCSSTGCSPQCSRTDTPPATSTQGTLRTGSDADGSDCTICTCGTPGLWSASWSPAENTVCSNAITNLPSKTRDTTCTGSGGSCVDGLSGSCGTNCTYNTSCSGTTCTKTETKTTSGTKCCDSGGTEITTCTANPNKTWDSSTCSCGGCKPSLPACAGRAARDADCNCPCTLEQACIDAGNSWDSAQSNCNHCIAANKQWTLNDGYTNANCTGSCWTCSCPSVGSPTPWSAASCTDSGGNDLTDGKNTVPQTSSATGTCTGGSCSNSTCDIATCLTTHGSTHGNCTSCTLSSCTGSGPTKSCTLTQEYQRNASVCCDSGNIDTGSSCVPPDIWDSSTCTCITCNPATHKMMSGHCCPDTVQKNNEHNSCAKDGRQVWFGSRCECDCALGLATPCTGQNSDSSGPGPHWQLEALYKDADGTVTNTSCSCRCNSTRASTTACAARTDGNTAFEASTCKCIAPPTRDLICTTAGHYAGDKVVDATTSCNNDGGILTTLYPSGGQAHERICRCQPKCARGDYTNMTPLVAEGNCTATHGGVLSTATFTGGKAKERTCTCKPKCVGGNRFGALEEVRTTCLAQGGTLSNSAYSGGKAKERTCTCTIACDPDTKCCNNLNPGGTLTTGDLPALHAAVETACATSTASSSCGTGADTSNPYLFTTKPCVCEAPSCKPQLNVAAYVHIKLAGDDYGIGGVGGTQIVLSRMPNNTKTLAKCYHGGVATCDNTNFTGKCSACSSDTNKYKCYKKVLENSIVYPSKAGNAGNLRKVLDIHNYETGTADCSAVKGILNAVKDAINNSPDGGRSNHMKFQAPTAQQQSGG